MHLPPWYSQAAQSRHFRVGLPQLSYRATGAVWRSFSMCPESMPPQVSTNALSSSEPKRDATLVYLTFSTLYVSDRRAGTRHVVRRERVWNCHIRQHHASWKDYHQLGPLLAVRIQPCHLSLHLCSYLPRGATDRVLAAARESENSLVIAFHAEDIWLSLRNTRWKPGMLVWSCKCFLQHQSMRMQQAIQMVKWLHSGQGSVNTDV